MKIKKTIFFALCILFSFILFFTFTSCQMAVDQNNEADTSTEDINGFKITKCIVDPADPNLNPNWNWTEDKYYSLYYGPGPNCTLVYRQLPFFTPGHPLNKRDIEKDMYPEDGWVLAFRDFGTPGRAPDLPYFVLYNKYRGIFRIMFYNAREFAYTNYKVALQWKETARTGAYFTMTDKDKCFLNNYDKEKQEFFITSASVLNGWGYADFIMTGYDPNADSNAVINIAITGQRIQQTATTGTITLEQELASNTVGGAKGTSDTLLTAAKNGVKYFNDVNSAKDKLKKFAENNSTKSWSVNLLKKLNGTLGTVAPIIGGVMGAVLSFIGGKDTPAPQEPMIFNGNLSTEGTITESQPLITFAFYLKPGTLSTQAYRPVQEIKWGIFNVISKPVFNFKKTVSTGYDMNNQMVYYYTEEWGFTDRNWYILNPSLNIVSVKTAPVNSYNGAGTYGKVPQKGWYIYDSTGRVFYGNPFPGVSSSYAVEIIVKNPQAKYYDDEILIYKVFSVTIN